MEDWQKRVLHEHADVKANWDRLNEFRRSAQFEELPAADRALLDVQSNAMATYLAILQARINQFNQG